MSLNIVWHGYFLDGMKHWLTVYLHDWRNKIHTVCMTFGTQFPTNVFMNFILIKHFLDCIFMLIKVKWNYTGPWKIKVFMVFCNVYSIIYICIKKKIKFCRRYNKIIFFYKKMFKVFCNLFTKIINLNTVFYS